MTARSWEFKQQELANTAWAVATLEILERPLLNSLVDAVLGKREEFGTQELSSALWAFATLHFGSYDFWHLMTEAVSTRELQHFGAQSVSNTLWALATMRWRDVPILEALGAAALGRLPQFSVQALANTAWALAQLEMERQEMGMIQGEAMARLGQFQSQELATTAWAFGRFQDRYLSIMRAILEEAELRVSSSRALDAASASMLLEAFAPLRLGQRWLSTLQGRMEPQLVPGLGPLLCAAEEEGDLEMQIQLLRSLADCHEGLEDAALFAAIFRLLLSGKTADAEALWQAMPGKSTLQLGSSTWNFQALQDLCSGEKWARQFAALKQLGRCGLEFLVFGVKLECLGHAGHVYAVYVYMHCRVYTVHVDRMNSFWWFLHL